MNVRQRFLVSVFAILGVIAVGAFQGWAAEAERMSKEQLKELLGSSDVVVVDARRGGDWDSSDVKIQHAVRGDPGDVATWSAEIPKDKTVVVYCA